MPTRDSRYRVRTDSAGTGGWHIGDPADPRTTAVLKGADYDHPP